MDGLRLTEAQRKAFHGLTCKLKGDVLVGVAQHDLLIHHPASERWWRMSDLGTITRLQVHR